tara:strand:- start:57 stop:542 length:486 start_codon:yes stop_codon:yes gene_type:complete
MAKLNEQEPIDQEALPDRVKRSKLPIDPLYPKSRYDSQDYFEIIGEDVPDDIVTPVTTFIPPTEKDYEKGFFNRYFIARYDSNFATEVSMKYFTKKFSKLPDGLYLGTNMKWYITNNNLPVLDSIRTTITAESVNRHNTEIESKRLPQLKNTIKDFTQFFR